MISPVTATAPSASPLLSASPTAAAPASGDFSTVLAGLASNAAQTVRDAEKTSMAGILGQASTQDVVESVMAAERALSATIAIRDKAVAAYLEISRMAI
jgi:flagellar hook-basal body complex protein FliE